jgi:hypothetical protein
MAILGTINKQSREVLDFDIDYATVLAGGSDTITTATSEVTPAGLTLVSTTLNANKAKVVFSAGTNTQLYKVTVLATSSASLIYEDEVNVLIGDV